MIFNQINDFLAIPLFHLFIPPGKAGKIDVEASQLLKYLNTHSINASENASMRCPLKMVMISINKRNGYLFHGIPEINKHQVISGKLLPCATGCLLMHLLDFRYHLLSLFIETRKISIPYSSQFLLIPFVFFFKSYSPFFNLAP